MTPDADQTAVDQAALKKVGVAPNQRRPKLDSRELLIILGAAAVLMVIGWINFWIGPLSTKSSHSLSLGLGSIHVPVSVTVVVALLVAVFFVGVIFYVVFESAFWTSPFSRALATVTVAVSLLGLIGEFVATYLQETYESGKCFGTYLDHANSIYVTITTFTTLGPGDLHPASTPCRFLVAGQSVIGLSVIAIAIAGLVTRLLATYK